MITLALAGDVMLGRGVNEVLPRMGPVQPWGDVLPLFRSADLRIVNLECAITSHRQPWQRTPKVFHFRADPAAVVVLQTAGIQACSLANNHTLDFEEQGLLETLQLLDEAGIQHAGAGRNQAEAARPAILTAGTDPAIRVALLACTDNEPDFAATPDRPGTNYLPVSLEPAILRQVEAGVEAARAGGAQVVVFSNHWGPNMCLRPSPLFRQFARAVIDRGVDVYYGHSAHLFQGVEIYRGKPILYDTGDFLDDYYIDPELHNDWSFLFRLALEDGVLQRLELFPVFLSYAQIQFAPRTIRDEIFTRMEQLSAEMGTTFVRREASLTLEHATNQEASRERQRPEGEPGASATGVASRERQRPEGEPGASATGGRAGSVSDRRRDNHARLERDRQCP